MEGRFTGLTNAQVSQNLKLWGLNEIEDPEKVSAIKIIIRQLKNNFIIYLLLAAAIISFFVGESVTGFTVMGVILMVIGVSFFQEYRAKKAIEALRDMITSVSTVVREGKEQEIETSNIVPKDTLILRTGEKIPADCSIIEAYNLHLNESILTGEAQAVEKKAGEEIYAGTFIVNGKCIASVIKTGMKTKFGQIVGMIATSEKELPLMEKINRIAKIMVVAAIIVSALTGGLMLLRSEVLTSQVIINTLIVVIALMVSAFPEGLPVVLVTSLAVGVNRMAKNNAIVNRMSIIETLGETTVICSDKTGTITTGEMTVKKIYLDKKIIEVSGAGFEGIGKFTCGGSDLTTADEKKLRLLLTAVTLCNDTRIERAGIDDLFKVFGSPTEGALLVAAAKAGTYKEDINFKCFDEVPFSSERKMMSVQGDFNGKRRVFMKGAPEVILSKCRPDKEKEDAIIKANQQFTAQAYRTLAVAVDDEFLGLVALVDPPREEVAPALEICRQAGIKVKMITGDYKDTALAIAAQIGLKGNVLEGSELDGMDDGKLARIIGDYDIFVRVRPEHKLRIVRVLKSLGEVVTMTGDGVNDAPALKEAQIGVAMGNGGTDVSRSVADLTLKDNNFATIVMAIKEGRTIFNNMRKFVGYQLSCNYAELMILFLGVLLSPVFGWQTPILLALQILFMNLVTDDLPAITFSFNRSSRDVMLEGPRKKPEVINGRLLSASLLAGAVMTLLTLMAFYVSYNIFGQTTVMARTTALITLILLEIVNAFNFRSFRYLTLNRSPLSNRYLFAASVISILISLGIIYTPVNTAFGTISVGPATWAIAVLLSLSFILAFDFLKIVNRRWHFLNIA